MIGRRVLVIACLGAAAILMDPAAARSQDRDREAILGRASLSFQEGMPVLSLEGSGYEIGYQHGRLLAAQVRRAVDQMLDYFAEKLKVPVLGGWIVSFLLDRTYNQLKSFIPEEFEREMQGLADGSGVSLRKIHRLHAVPDLYSTLCASGAFFGKATKTGRLYHLRNLDWNREIGIQDFPCLFIVKKEGKIPFVNIGYVSFTGSISGMNERGISIGQIGSENEDETLRGTPMPFLMRQILEEAGGLEDAVRILRDAKRTIGCNYILADAAAKNACAVETTAHQVEVFQPNDPKEKASPYALPLQDAAMRADFSVSPGIRNLQTSASGDPGKAGLEDPRGTSAYDKRYLGQALFVKANYGSLDEAMAKEMAKTIAPDSNVQSVIYAFPEFWVANAKGKRRAVDSEFHRFNLSRLLARQGTPDSRPPEPGKTANDRI